MVTVIQIKTSVIEWLQERLNIDAGEALELAQEFVGMLYYTGAFTEPESEVDPGSSPEEQAADKEAERAAQEGRDVSS